MSLNRLKLLGLVAGALVMGSALADAQTFELLVTQTPPGSIDITNPANWGGVLQYNIAGTGGAATAGGNNIGSTSLTDPAGLAYSNSLGQLFVGNRHGNSGNTTISRFFHVQSGPFTANGSFGVAGETGIHQLAISPTTGELFASSFNGGIQRFTSIGTTPVAGSVILNGAIRGVAVSPDGNRLYATTGANVIRQFDLNTNTELTSLVVSGASGLHYLRFRGNNELYAADFDGDQIFRFSVLSDNLTGAGSFASTDPIGLAFSPDLSEMFVSTHQTSSDIHRYLFNSNTNSWNFTSNINVGTSLGDIIVIPVPEPALGSLAIGGALLLLRRRK